MSQALEGECLFYSISVFTFPLGHQMPGEMLGLLREKWRLYAKNAFGCVLYVIVDPEGFSWV